MTSDIEIRIKGQMKDRMGRYRTQSLFIEHKNPDYPAPFTLQEHDVDGAVSLYRKYMELQDPTEYTVAKKLLGSWKHWTILAESSWFNPILEEWRAELQVSLTRQRLREMSEAAANGNVTASKWLDDKFGLKTTSKRGRPSNDERKAHLKAVTKEMDLLSEEAVRLGLVK